MDYDFDYNIKDIVLITDDNEKARPKMTDFIFKQLRTNGLNLIDVERFEASKLRKRKKYYSHRDRQIFNKSFDYITEPFSVNTLIKFTRQNPEFQGALKEDPSSFKEILWQEYQKRFHQPDSLHEIVEHYEIGQQFAAKFPDAHVLIVLFFHKVISPNLQSNGTINYHSVGRGFYGYGSCKPIEPEIGSPGRAKILMSPKAVSDRVFEKKKAFARRVFFHEYWGHLVNNLDDHFTIPMKKCIMSAAPSLESFIQNALENKELCFCEECLDKIHHLPKIALNE
jgi:hypothetical protein